MGLATGTGSHPIVFTPPASKKRHPWSNSGLNQRGRKVRLEGTKAVAKLLAPCNGCSMLWVTRRDAGSGNNRVMVWTV